MKQVQLRLTVDSDQYRLHPICYDICRAQYIDAASTIRWTCARTTLRVTHLIKGDGDRLKRAFDSITSVSNVEVTPIEDDVSYVHHTISIGERAVSLLADLIEYGIEIVPPIVYRRDGTVAVKLVGRTDAMQQVITKLPDQLHVEVNHIGEYHSKSKPMTSLLSERQRDAIVAAVELGYYELPREAYIEDIAEEIGCAESTAGEHLRKAETRLLGAIVSGNYRHNGEDTTGDHLTTPLLLP